MLKKLICIILSLLVFCSCLCSCEAEQSENSESYALESHLPKTETGGVYESDAPKTAEEVKREMLSVMSFNVWVGEVTEERIERVVTMIKRYSPDTFGVQEASAVWMNELSEAFPDYSYVGDSRDGKGTPGETSAVFYKKEKFNLIDGGTKWLSDTPDVEGSKYSAAAFPRVMSYALLERKADGVRFFHVNTHLDHINLLIMKKQAEVLMNEISKLPDHPVILTGDFNCVPRSIPYNVVVKSFENSSAVAKKVSGGSTFHGNENIDKVIDFIFFEAKGGFEVESYKVCNEKINGKLVSDHHPIYSEYVITK